MGILQRFAVVLLRSALIYGAVLLRSALIWCRFAAFCLNNNLLPFCCALHYLNPPTTDRRVWCEELLSFCTALSAVLNMLCLSALLLLEACCRVSAVRAPLQGLYFRDYAAGTMSQGLCCRSYAARASLQGLCSRGYAAGVILQGLCCRSYAAGAMLQEPSAGATLQGQCCRDYAAWGFAAGAP